MRDACGNTFHLFAAGGDSVVINHSLFCSGVTLFGIGDATDAPPASARHGLHLRAVPNPFNPTTRVRVESGSAWRDLVVVDVRGRVVRSLAPGAHPAGTSEWTWDGRNDAPSRLASGVYIVTAQGERAPAACRVVLVQ